MTDPLDVLHRPLGATAPNPRFRRDVLAMVQRELSTDDPSTVATAQVVPPPTPAETEVAVTEPSLRSRRRTIAIGVLSLAAAALLIVGVALVNRDDADSPPADDPVATTAPPIASTTTPAVSDASIAEAALLSRQEIGGGYVVGGGDTFGLDRAIGPGTADTACAPFLDTVFESADRPATVATRHFVTSGATFQQYVVVFPDEAGAVEMMRSVADPAFPACMAAVITEAYSVLEADTVTEHTPMTPIPPRPLAAAGDDMVVLAFTGTFKFGGVTRTDEGMIPFVRVGRAVMWMNPNSAKTAVNSPGYPDAQLEKALSTAADKLRAAQTG